MSASHGALTAISAADKVEEDTSRAWEPSLPKDPEDYDGIRMEHVSYGYEGRGRTLRDVSLRIPRGSVVALVGLSGCGQRRRFLARRTEAEAWNCPRIIVASGIHDF